MYYKMTSKNKQSRQSQIRRKLAHSGITSPQQFEEIIGNLVGQQERLNADLNLLREKVTGLQRKQAMRQTTKNLKKKYSASKSQINYRQELSRKYEELKHWQKLSLRAMKNSRLEIEFKKFLDKLNCVEMEIQTGLKELNDEYTINKRLMKAFKAMIKQQKVTTNPKESMEYENKTLKRRIFSMKNLKQQKSIRQIHLRSLFEFKQKDKQLVINLKQVDVQQRHTTLGFRKSLPRIKTQENKSSRAESYPDIVEEPIIDQPDPQPIQNEVQVYQIEEKLNTLEDKWKTSISNIENRIKERYSAEQLNELRQGSQLTFEKQFQMILENAKEKLQKLSETNKQKIKLYLQMNSMNKESHISNTASERETPNLAEIRMEKQILDDQEEMPVPLKRSRTKSFSVQNGLIQKNIEQSRKYQETSIQTQPLQEPCVSSFRKEYIGQINQDESSFFDRDVLCQQTQTSLKTLNIYYTDKGIATIKAIYRIHTSNTLKEGQLILPDDFIKNHCKVHVIDTYSGDFIRYFKIRYHKLQKRITQIKIVTNRNVKNGWGYSKIKGDEPILDENVEKELIFDINQDEYPASIFCSHIQKDSYWYLCGFGVEINDL